MIQVGTIVKIQVFQGIRTCILDSGYKFDTHQDLKIGDKVEVKPYIMGTILINKVKGE